VAEEWRAADEEHAAMKAERTRMEEELKTASQPLEKPQVE
jgi:hypothetical protein